MNISKIKFLALFCLSAVGLLTGCSPVSQAEPPSIPTPYPAPSLTGVVQVGELEELGYINEQLNDQLLTNIQINHHILLATIGQPESTRIIAINLQNKKTSELNAEFVADEQWPTSEQYFVYTQDLPDDDWYMEKLYIYDTSTGEKTEIGGSGRWLHTPSASGHTIVWSENTDIYAYDTEKQLATLVSQHPESQIVPKIDGEWIVYMQRRNSDMQNVMRDIYLHHLGTGEEMLLGPSPFAGDLEGDSYGIDNGRVLWIGWSAGEEPDLLAGSRPTLHLYDLQTRTESIIDVSPVCTRVPVGFNMAGDLILFGCDDGFCGYDLAQHVFFDVPYPHNSIGEVYLSETHVVFQIQDRGPVFWDYMTPGASPMPSPEYWLTPQPVRFRWFAVPITR